MDIAYPHLAEVESVSFSFLSSHDVRSISVQKIDNPTLLDNLNLPTRRGLYDPTLGPLTARDTCVQERGLFEASAADAQLRDMSLVLLRLPWSLRPCRAARPRLPPHLHDSVLQPSPFDVYVLSSIQDAGSLRESV